MDDQLSQQTGEAPQPLSPGAIILLSVSGVTLLGLGLGFFWYRRNPQPFQRAWAVIERTQATPLPVHLERGLRRVGIRPPKRLQRWAEYALLPVLTRAYLEINRAIRVLGETTADHLTPAERAEKLIKLLPLAKEPAQRLLVEYHKATYSPYPADEDVGRQAGVEIRNLSLQVRLSKSLHHVQERWRRRLEGWF